MRVGRRHGRTTPKPISETWPHRRLVRALTRPSEEKLDRAPPPERALPCESDADVMQTTPMRGAARCDLFFVRVDPYSWFRLSAQRCASAAPRHARTERRRLQ